MKEFDLSHFLTAQTQYYAQVELELKQGKKQSHWIWFIFPQIEGLNESAIAQKFAIESLEEAQAYLNHPILGKRLITCTKIILNITDKTAFEILGPPDDKKFHSSMTLFAQLSISGSIFHQVLTQYFNGQLDIKTLDRL